MATQAPVESFASLYQRSNTSLLRLHKRRIKGTLIPRAAMEDNGLAQNRAAYVDIGLKAPASLGAGAKYTQDFPAASNVEGVFTIDELELNPLTAEAAVREEALYTATAGAAGDGEDAQAARVLLAARGFAEAAPGAGSGAAGSSSAIWKEDVVCHALFEASLPEGFAQAVGAQDLVAEGPNNISGIVLNGVPGGFAVGLGGVVAFLPYSAIGR